MLWRTSPSATELEEVTLAWLRKLLALPDIKEKMAALGMEPRPTTPAQMDERIKHDIAKWRVVIDKAGIPKQ